MDLIARLGFDGRGFSKGLADAVGNVKHTAHEMENAFSRNFGGISGKLLGGLGIDSLEGFAEKIVHHSAEIKDLSEQFGISTDEVQRLQYAASQAGLEFDKFGMALRKIGHARKEAATGNEELRETFEKYHITLDDLQNPALRDLDLLEKLAHALAGVNLDPRQREELRELLGPKGGDKLAATFEKLEHVQIKLISHEDIENIDHAVKALERLQLTLLALGAKPLGAWAEVIEGHDKVGALGKVWHALSPEAMIGEFLGKKLGTKLAERFIDWETAGQPSAEHLPGGPDELSGENRPSLDLYEEKIKKGRSTAAPAYSFRDNPRINDRIQHDSLARIGGLTTNARGTYEADMQERLVKAAEKTALNTDPKNFAEI